MTDTIRPHTGEPGTTVPHAADPDIGSMTTEDIEAFADRFFGAVLGAQEIQAAYFGDTLGWYRALAERGPLTAGELAAATGTHRRYAQEWLEHQGVVGWVTVDDPAAGPLDRRYSLPSAHACVLTDQDSLAHLAPLARFVTGVGRRVDDLVDAYRSGGGVSWATMGDDLRLAQAALNRPMFLQLLGKDYLPSIPEVDIALSAGGRVADIGCGLGWSSIAVAQQYPTATVDGFDPDVPSVERASAYAREAGVDDRVRFHAVDPAAGAAFGSYDLVMALECIHDVPHPTELLSAMRRLAGDTGVVLVMDERVDDEYRAPGGPFERLLYGCSLTSCLPDSMSAGEHSAAIGTVMRPATFERHARAAGFGAVEVLPIENDSFRFYRLHPVRSPG